MAKLKLGVLISGRGSNMLSLIHAANKTDYPAEIAMVISNNANAGGLTKASDAGIVTVSLPHRAFANQEYFETALHEHLTSAKVDLICLAGFMRILSPEFVGRWKDRLINIHPSILPAFKGLHVHERVLEAGVQISGCTVHFVRPEMDDGPIIIQAAVPVETDDDEASLSARVLAAEHQIYPQAVEMIARGEVRVSGNRALIEPRDDAVTRDMAALINPAP